MQDKSSGDLLGPKERQFFAEQFEKDLVFFQLFFLLVNKSSPIKRVDLVWAKDGPAERVGLKDVFGGAHPLDRVCAGLLDCEKSADPAFCNLVSDFGRREAESCSISDRAAEARVRQTAKAEVYRCHFGLIEIAVPVFGQGKHIATLFNGQVLDSSPTEAGFAKVCQAVSELPHVNLEQLRKAYFEVPVVTEEEIRNARLILESFADYLVTDWQRLSEIIHEQRRQVRESQLYRKEFAHLMLEGADVDPASLREAMERIGFTRYPNRVLVAKLEAQNEAEVPETPFELGFTAALQAIEELCEKKENAVAAYLRKSGICVFFNDQEGRNRAAGDFYAHRFATSIVNAVQARCDLRVRVGIGDPRSDWRHIPDSYHEACIALAARHDAIATYEKPTATFEELSGAVENICYFIRDQKLDDARLALTALPLIVNRRLGEAHDPIGQQRLFFAGALESMCIAAQRLGTDSAVLARLVRDATAKMEHETVAFELHRAFLQAAEYTLDEVRQLHAGKYQKLVERACRMIDQSLEQLPCAAAISLSATASAFGISPGHFSRTFRHVTGITFERYVMLRRVDLAKRLLLEPLSNSTEVAERCGFTDPSYFARVFRKLSGCSPSDYAKDPGHRVAAGGSRQAT